MLTIGTTVLGVGDVVRATAFWTAALEYAARDGGDEIQVILDPRKGDGARLALMRSESPVQIHPRIHLDLWANDPDAEVQRLLELGAERVDWDLYPDDVDFTVLADPEGNRFCVLDASQP
jgi:predicted enzyme related to lactoylglutathione lyase